MAENYYPSFSPFKTGMIGKCPRCARGKLFDGYLGLAAACSNCKLSFDFADAGDGAAWFVMLFACVFGVGSIVGFELAYEPAIWILVLIGLLLIVVIPLLMLRPMKGLLIAQQWNMNAHEGQIEK
jgi:uncharacterized protein (DUF983 family)